MTQRKRRFYDISTMKTRRVAAWCFLWLGRRSCLWPWVQRRPSDTSDEPCPDSSWLLPDCRRILKKGSNTLRHHKYKKRLFPEQIQIYHWRSIYKTHEHYNTLIKTKWNSLQKAIKTKWNYLQKIIKGPASVKLGSDRNVCTSRLINSKSFIHLKYHCDIDIEIIV
jgi:hypothetical protein